MSDQSLIYIEQPGAELLLSDTFGARRERIWGPLQLTAHLMVEKAMRRSHDDDGARYHRNRPALKTCPYDPACRFV